MTINLTQIAALLFYGWFRLTSWRMMDVIEVYLLS